MISGAGVGGLTLLTVWLRMTPPFSWVWPYIERASDATGLTKAAGWGERAIQFVWGEAKASLRIMRQAVSR